MKKRNRIKIFGEWVTLDHVDLTSEGIYGDCTVSSRTIRLHVGLEGAEYKRVLAHESEHMRLGISGLSEMMSAELEEALAVLAETR